MESKNVNPQGNNNDIVMVSLSGKKFNQYMYDKIYLYSLTKEKLLEPKRTEKSVSGDYWNDRYFLQPGTYLLIEVNINDIKNSCIFKCLTVFTKEDYIQNKKNQFPDLEIKVFKTMYQYNGYDIGEWKDEIPSWIEVPCLSDSQIGTKKDIYKQPKEVEDKLSLLSITDEKKSAIQLLIQKKNKK